uniref:2,3-bisphosphoglycerate-independent phosphoglycerate mutase n=1 Tax=Scinaia undulata TaxID=1884664 RepID=A0A1G4NXD9_9FLOR|nr:Phosphoglycerate mutase [Scinaia undulata]SCW23340.1 Phosphoglycerate mutase [Scinaia undulata]
MKKQTIHPIILTILDGWGDGYDYPGNSIHLAKTPTIDAIMQTYPRTSLNASGLSVGLPKNQVGNSEVGHMSIGGGRIIPQDLVRITNSIEKKSFYSNETLKSICLHANNQKSKVHLIGLCSDGGVHSHINHLIALLDLLKENEVEEVCIHFIADGRDTPSNCAIEFIKEIMRHTESIDLGRICTISGRYYAMDRDCRWSRTEATYNILTNNSKIDSANPIDVIKSYYQQDISDEFIIPTKITDDIIEDNDGIIFFNFRPDRMRQLVQAFAKHSFKGFGIEKIKNLQMCTFTRYDSTLDVPIVFRSLSKSNFLGEIVAQNHLKQLRIAETEKYAHVTYFFNGGIEEPFAGEDRELVLSPQVKTYDETPEMSADQITQGTINAINKNIYSLIIINYANPDMVGHTGNLKKTIEAIETVDKCIAEILDAVSKFSGTMIITADHGNAEYMIDKIGQPCKSHTINTVPFILIEGEGNKIAGHGGNVRLRKNGSLADIAPTILDILHLNKPADMTGSTLIEKSKYEFRNKIQLNQ